MYGLGVGIGVGMGVGMGVWAGCRDGCMGWWYGMGVGMGACLGTRLGLRPWRASPLCASGNASGISPMTSLSGFPKCKNSLGQSDYRDFGKLVSTSKL